MRKKKETPQEPKDLLSRFHTLVDHELAGPLAQKQAAELRKIEEKLDRVSGVQKLERKAERRHLAILQKLDELTSELRNLRADGPLKADAKARRVGTLVEFFANSPLRGSGLKLRRIKDRPRKIDL